MDIWMDRLTEAQNEREQQWNLTQERYWENGGEHMPVRLGGKDGRSFVWTVFSRACGLYDKMRAGKGSCGRYRAGDVPSCAGTLGAAGKGEKKNLSIDAVDCDLRGVSEETLKQYGEISINAVAVYVTERTQELLARYHVKIDANTVEKLEEDEKIVTHNGVYRLTGTEGGAEKVHLQVNGKLYVEKSAEEALKNYKSIQVNGKVVCPESLGSAL